MRRVGTGGNSYVMGEWRDEVRGGEGVGGVFSYVVGVLCVGREIKTGERRCGADACG